MAMAPKKKYEYFDRGRGIADLYVGEDHSDSSSSPRPTTRDDVSPPSGESTPRQSPYNAQPSSPLEYPSTAPASPISPPLSAYPPPTYPHHYPEYHHALIGAHYPQEAADLSLPVHNGAYVRAYAPPEMPRLIDASVESYNGEMSSAYVVDDDELSDRLGPRSAYGCANGRGGSKRPQRCRMCANHSKTVDMKGHKWYCPFRECSCKDCDITRKTQYYMKERQKLTRHQQQQQHEDRYPIGAVGSPGCYETPRRRPVQSTTSQQSADMPQMDFPRVREMVSQTRNILDYDLFEKVNQACRPKASSNVPQ